MSFWVTFIDFSAVENFQQPQFLDVVNCNLLDSKNLTVQTLNEYTGSNWASDLENTVRDWYFLMTVKIWLRIISIKAIMRLSQNLTWITFENWEEQREEETSKF